MPKVGDEEFAYSPEGIADAQQKAADTGQPIENQYQELKDT